MLYDGMGWDGTRAGVQRIEKPTANHIMKPKEAKRDMLALVVDTDLFFSVTCLLLANNMFYLYRDGDCYVSSLPRKFIRGSEVGCRLSCAA